MEALKRERALSKAARGSSGEGGDGVMELFAGQKNEATLESLLAARKARSRKRQGNAKQFSMHVTRDVLANHLTWPL